MGSDQNIETGSTSSPMDDNTKDVANASRTDWSVTLGTPQNVDPILTTDGNQHNVRPNELINIIQPRNSKALEGTLAMRRPSKINECGDISENEENEDENEPGKN